MARIRKLVRQRYFLHARQYEKPDATTDPENPMSMAREFVRSHEEIRVFWGTDFYKGCTPKEGQAARQEAQRKLSTQLGCWVRDNDCVVASDLTFFPKVGLMLPDKPQTAYKELIKDKDLPAKIAFSESKKLDKFIPDPEVESKIRLHLSTIKAARNKWARWVHLDSVRELKIIALTHIVEAYKVGNYDVLRHYAQHAHNQTSPFADPDAKSVWRSQEGTTRKLAEMAHKSAYEIISAMGQNGCGLNKDGEPIASYRHYQPSPKLDPLRI
ncbi:hypothetical protein OQJ15_02200 [Fluoribacter dumoffii]|uniref:hypothetical protein n=1 Tax=Fluoribacter dumoffii TaxID=463 RepID=UPI0022439A5B|nr:hypothetical protein [Fluoribacter dumoffii]MCW8385110.1 hypothetical protein [Fluoribacter dumoffii]MCW8496592.1 hypothetical protein [Fluoribacter dumoffii]